MASISLLETMLVAAPSNALAPPNALALPLSVASSASVWAASMAESLRSWFGAPFSLVRDSGELVQVASGDENSNWPLRCELCREVARRGRPEFIEECDPVLVLAVPLAPPGENGWVAVGAFLTRPATGPGDLARVSAMLGVSPAQAAHWVGGQSPLSANALERLARLAMDKIAADVRLDRLEGEIATLSERLGETYEEISLLYRLAQNLKLSSNDADLGQLALEWLADVLPAEGIALYYNGASEPDVMASDSAADPVLLTHGNCPLDAQDMASLTAQFEAQAMLRPLVLNRAATGRPGWSFPNVRELIVVPVAEGDRVFGWLATFNHVSGGEFGTAEAGLLNSVAAMLGIHSGNIDLYRQQAELLAGVVRAMTSAIDAKDPYTCGHSDRVARVAVRLAQELGCDSETIKTIYFSGLLHDIGKIGINDEVLRKPGRLSEAEFEHIKTHVDIGHRILADLKTLSHMLPVVLHHHESWDGAGYPQGLCGENIPYLARIVAVADAYDAMASDRPYRTGMEDDKLDAIMRSGAGRQWDPQVVEAFFRAREDIRAISGRGAVGHVDLSEISWT